MDKVDITTLLEEGSIKELFNKLDADRTTVLDRGRNCSALTIPSILPKTGHSEETQLQTPYQALGARLVNNLAAKLLLSLLPPNTPFFRLLVEEEAREILSTQAGTKSQETGSALTELDQQLSIVEQEILKQIEREALRVPTFEAIKSLIVTGNSLCYKTEESLDVFKLTDYVVQRDYSGNPIEIITKMVVLKATLDQEILEQLQQSQEVDESQDIEVYTRATLRNGEWIEYQQIEAIFIEGSEQRFKPDKLPYMPLRWSAINGENYGRGLVEQYLGDFRTLEGLYQLLIEHSAVAGRTIFGKRPGSILDIKELNEAENGQCIYGDLESDITVLRVEKGNDLQAPMQLVQDLTRRLEQAFLVASSAVRDSERTTALEIRYLASDLEQALGGLYSVLALEFQRPLATILLSKIDLGSSGLVNPVIVTGLEALGRNNELDKLRQLNAFIMELGTPEILLQRLNIDNYISMVGSALGINTTTLIKSNQQIQQEQEQSQAQALMQQGAGNIVDGATKEATTA